MTQDKTKYEYLQCKSLKYLSVNWLGDLRQINISVLHKAGGVSTVSQCNLNH